MVFRGSFTLAHIKNYEDYQNIFLLLDRDILSYDCND